MSKQIILTASVDNLGVQGDTVKVADGYARNFLIPRGLGIPATAGNLRRIDTLRQKHAADLAARLDQAQALVKQLTKQSYTITAAAGPDNKLFGSVTATDIAAALKAKNLDVDRRQIVLEKPIHTLGVHEIEVKLHPEVVAKIQVTVVSASSAGPASGSESPPATRKPSRRK